MSVYQLNSLFSPQSSYLKCRTLPQPPTLLERVARGERRVDSTKLFTTEHNNSPYQATAFSFHLEILQLYLHFLWAMRNYIFILKVSEWYKFSKLMILDPSLLVCSTVPVNFVFFILYEIRFVAAFSIQKCTMVKSVWRYPPLEYK